MISQELIELIESSYNIKVLQVINVNTVLKIKTSNNKIYILKKMRNKKLIKIYNFLLSQKFTNFILPVMTNKNELYITYDNQDYYLMVWYDNIDYPIERKIIDYIDLLYKLHKNTTIRKTFNKAQFNKIYNKYMKNLNKQFSLLDLYLVECENKTFRSVFDWTFLIKYKEIMSVKNILLKIQSKIDELLEKIDQYDYCIIHNNSSIDHFVVTNDKNYLISFDNSTIGLKIYDYIKLFIEYSEYDVDWMSLIINDNISQFEFHFFIFNVMYYIIKNIEITFLKNNNSFEAINILVNNLTICGRAIDLYKKYESVNSTT